MNECNIECRKEYLNDRMYIQEVNTSTYVVFSSNSLSPTSPLLQARHWCCRRRRHLPCRHHPTMWLIVTAGCASGDMLNAMASKIAALEVMITTLVSKISPIPFSVQGTTKPVVKPKIQPNVERRQHGEAASR